MERIDMTQMVQPGRNVKTAKTSPDKSDAKTEFAQMLKDKEQAVQGEKKKPKPEKNDDGQEEVKESGKQEDGSQLPDKEGDIQVPAEVMLQLQAALNQLMENPGQTAVQAEPENPAELLAAGQEVPASESGMDGRTDMTSVVAESIAESITEGKTADAGKTAGEEMAAMALKETDEWVLPAGRETAVQEPDTGDKGTVQTVAESKTQPMADDSAQIVYREAARQEEPGHEDGGNRDSRNGEDSAYANSIQNMHNRALSSDVPANGQGDTVTVRTTPETFPADVGKAIAAKMPGNNGTLTIELEPASLGKMTIRVVYEAGRAAVSIMSDNPKTLELLSQSAGDIAQILEEKTGQQTVVYTPDSQEELDGRRDGQESGGQRQDREEEKRQERPDSFAQQLRLGLV